MKIINFKNKKMKLLTNEQQKSYQNSKICYICKEKFEEINMPKTTNIVELGTILIIQENIEMHIVNVT